jgi:LacI family transcriptional regulator
MFRHVLSAKTPCVNISAVDAKGVDLPRVLTHLEACSRLAAEHFLDRGFCHFAYYAVQWLPYETQHCQSFVRALSDAGRRCLVYQSSASRKTAVGWHRGHRDLVRWLKGLSKPTALLTFNAELARDAIFACREGGLAVPEDVAVLAGDEDDLICEACVPSISGLARTSERIGYRAAALLDHLMRGGRAPRRPILIEPTGVITRQSTAMLAIDDPDLASAISFIRDHATEGIQVPDVLRAVSVSRRWLERRCQTALGRTPAAEIRRVRVERAKHLLAETELRMPDVAAAAGFTSHEYFAQAFKAHAGQSPLRYRILARGRG